MGLATCTIVESTFGKHGARYIASIIFAVNLIGWFGINNGECALAFSNFLQSQYGIEISYYLSCLIWGVIMTLTAVYGVSAIEKLDVVGIPLLMAIMVVGTFMAIQIHGIEAIHHPVEETMSFIDGVALSFNFYACGAIMQSDMTRYQKSRRDTVLSTFIGVFPLGIITMLLGGMMTKIANEYDISMVLISVGIPVLGILSLVISTWTTNVTNAYMGALDVVKIFNVPDHRRREVTIAVGLVGTVLGMVGILDAMMPFLAFLAYLVCPIGGVMFADYFVLGKGKPENWHSREGFHWIGVVTWGISAVLAYLVRLEFSGIGFAVIIYLVLTKCIPQTNKIGGGLT
ncbi:MAG: cytosine permease [Eubacteriales bacterium]